MAAIGDRIAQWTEERSKAWKDRLAGWAVGIASRGAEKLLDDMEPELVNQARSYIETMRDTPGLPPEARALLENMLKPKSFAMVPALLAIIIPILMGIAASVFKGSLEGIRQQAEKLTPLHVPDLGVVMDMRLREKMDEAEYRDLVARNGWSVDWANRFLDLKHPVLPSSLALPAWLRDKAKYQKYVDQLPRLGLTADDIELLTELEYKIPGVQDIIRYVVKEAYDPATVAEFGQALEYPQIAEADAAKTGVRPDQLMKEWISHWELPGVTQGYEMMHRGEITPAQLARLLKARDVMPFWRDKLTAISWALPGRIETRMMALYGLIDKAGVMKLLEKDGLAAEYRDVVADMNIVRGVKSDLQVRYTNGWINAQELQAEIAAQNLLPAIAEQLYKSIVKNAKAARTVTQKDLTLAQIIKGIKKGKLDRAQGVDLVMDLGYDAAEAKLILDIEVPEDDTDAAKKARELTKADILAGLKTKTITMAQARAKLIATRYTAGDADFILKVYQASIKPAAPEKVKEVTRADIEKSVTLGLVTPGQAHAMLLDLKYTPEAASFILTLRAEKDTPEAAARRAELAKSDILGGLKSDVLTEAQALEKLQTLGYLPADAAYIVNVYQASIKIPEPSPPKQYTRADVITAVKKGLVTQEQGYELLLDIGYAEDAASFILNVQAEESPFSPLNYQEFKDLTSSYRAAIGAATEPLPTVAQELQLEKARAIAEGRDPVLEQLRIQIDTIRRRRRSGTITRDQEISELQKLQVPADYITALVENDDTRIEARKAKP